MPLRPLIALAIAATVSLSACADNIDTAMESYSMTIAANGHIMTATMVANSSTAALRELLEQGDITVDMHDYGNFEKVGQLPQSLPRNDEPITTSAGDIILYQGNQFVIYYDTNSWNFTRLGRIDGLNQAALKSILGVGDVTVTLSLTAAGVTSAGHNDTYTEYYHLDGTKAPADASGVLISKKGNTAKKIVR